jgi:hypothetical protein
MILTAPAKGGRRLHQRLELPEFLHHGRLLKLSTLNILESLPSRQERTRSLLGYASIH